MGYCAYIFAWFTSTRGCKQQPNCCNIRMDGGSVCKHQFWQPAASGSLAHVEQRQISFFLSSSVGFQATKWLFTSKLVRISPGFQCCTRNFTSMLRLEAASISLSSIKGRLSLKVIFRKWIRHQTLRQPQEWRRPQIDRWTKPITLSEPSIKGRHPQRPYSNRGRLPSKVVFHQTRFSRLHKSVTICWLNHMTMLNACAQAHAFASLTQWKW